MSIKNRIQECPTCRSIPLKETERKLYQGTGWMLARFIDDTLIEIFNPLENAACYTSIDEVHKAAVSAAREWLENDEGEVYQVLCSCLSLCDPEPCNLIDESFDRFSKRIHSTIAAFRREPS